MQHIAKHGRVTTGRLLAAEIIVGLLLCILQIRQTDLRMRKDHLANAVMIAQSLNVHRIGALSGTPDDIRNPSYSRLKQQFADIIAAQPMYRFIYLMGRKGDGTVFFYVDNERMGSPDETVAGEVYDEISQGYLRVFNSEKPGVAGPVTDRWGTWITSLVPIFDPVDKQLSAVLGVDENAARWRIELARSAVLPVCFSLVMILITLTGSILLRYRRLLGAAASRILFLLEPGIAAAVGITISVFFAWFIHDMDDRTYAQAFRLLAESRSDNLRDLFRYLSDMELEGLAQFIENSRNIDDAEFRNFSGHLVRDPAVKAWEWIPVVREDQKQETEKMMQTAGFPHYFIWEKDRLGDRIPARGRQVYYPVCFTAPVKGNEAAMGFDLGSEYLRRTALEQVKTTGLVCCTEPIRLVQETGRQIAILVIHPVYARDDGHTLKGFALAVLRMGEVLRGTSPDFRSINMTLSVIGPGSMSVELASSGSVVRQSSYAGTFLRPILAFGKTFIVTASPGPDFARTHPLIAGWLVLFSGFAVTAALTLVLNSYFNSRRKMEDLVTLRTAQLEESRSRLFLSTERLKLAASAARFGVWDVNLMTGSVEWDEWMYRLYGVEPDSVADVSEFWRMSLHPGDSAAVYNDFEPAVSGTNDHSAEFRIILPDGHIRCIKEYAVVSRDTTGKPVRMTGINYDITSLHEAEEKMRSTLEETEAARHAESGIRRELQVVNRQLEEQTVRATKMAEQAEAASKAKSEFLANMSHEIRTPMNGVIGMIGLLLDTRLTSEQRRYAETVRTSGEAMLYLINGILDFSKIEAGKMELENLFFDLQVLLDDFISAMATQVQAKNIELMCGVEPSTPVLLAGDPGRLRQILTNITGNALKFTHDGEVVIRVAALAEDEDSVMLRFSVRDTGIGIPDDKIGLLFNKFSQVDASTTRRFGGSGLGLAISRELVAMMGGEIDVSSKVGIGSEFRFTVRCGRQKLAPPPDIGNEPFDAMRVLVVDDNATNCDILQTTLTSWGMRVSSAERGGESLETLAASVTEEDPVDIVLIDQRMPGMDGEKLGLAIRNDIRLSSMRMVLMTSPGDRHDSIKLTDTVFCAYLAKPVRVMELKSVMRRISGTGSDVVPETYLPSETIRPATLPDSMARARILLAEDNVVNQQVAMGILGKFGLKSDAVANGAEALAALENVPYDLVLMDVQMPEMDGFAAAARIRDPASPVLDHGVPVIAMTANALEGDRERCLAAGMNDYISKPVNPGALMKVLERWLSGRRESDAAVAVTQNEPLGMSHHDENVWDNEGLLERLTGDVGIARKVVKVFLVELPKQLAFLKKSIAENDIAEVQRLAHTFKGAAANVGASAMQDAAARMEASAAAADIEGAAAGIPDLERYLVLTDAAIRRVYTIT